MSHHTGEIAGLCASLTWAVSSLVFSRVRAPAGALNLFKNLVASILLLATLCTLAAVNGAPILTANRAACGWLALSGLVGVVVGDTCYFRSLQILGVRRSLTLSTLAPPLAAVLGWLVLDERPSSLAWVGMAVTLGGVLLVIGDPRLRGDAAGHYPGSVLSGVLNGFVGSLCQALGAVFSKKGMEAVEPLEASFIRLAMAAGVVFLCAFLLGKLGDWRRLLLAPGVPAPLAGAAACGTYVGIWLSLTAFKHTKIAVATTLTALSPVFVLPLAWVFLGSRITPRALAGACLAVGGVAMLF